MKLKKQKSVFLYPKAPYNFDASMHKPGHFSTPDVFWQKGTKWQTMLWQNKKLGLKFEDKGTVAKPKVKLSIYSAGKVDDDFASNLVKELKYRLRFGLDLKEFNRHFKSDPQLGPIIKKWRGLRPLNYSSLYEYLIIGVMLQNCTVRRSIQMMEALFKKYGTLLEFDGKKLYCFWLPEKMAEIPEQELRDLKVGYRAKSIKKISQDFAQGKIDEFVLRKKDKEEQMKTLLQLYGVGPATVWYILFDVFHQYDFFNHISPWEQKIYSKLFFNQDPEKPASVKKLIKYFTKYGKYKQLAVHYIWEDLWWKRKNKHIPWLEKLIRI
jgi:3-methyladenine DNA glycosylase/8-oxoguanine DNA glycosylase